MHKTYLSVKQCDGCGRTFSHKNKRYITKLTSTNVMNRLNNFYGEEKVRLGDLICLTCKNNIICIAYKSDALLTNQHGTELEIHNETEQFVNPKDFTDESIIDNYSSEIDKGPSADSNELDSTNSEGCLQNLNEHMNLDESLIINRITVDIPRTTASHRYCFICQKESSKKKLHNVPNKAIVDTFIQLRILIPFNTKCYQDHLQPNLTIKPESIN